ncbi:MAG TPA: oligosaccharide flippase family protein, partial [Alteraurantiacibacter sp.]
MTDKLASQPAPDGGDIAALAKGGRTNFFGFLLRLAARVPFLFIAGRLYGAEALGIFASALVVIEVVAQLGAMGQKRGLAQQLTKEDVPPTHAIADGMVLSLLTGSVLSIILMLFPQPMFPSGQQNAMSLLLPLAIIPFCLTDIALAALAYRYDIGSTVKARSVVEPWALSIAALALFYIIPEGGLPLAYIISIVLTAVAAIIPLLREYGLPYGWRPCLGRTARLAWGNLPLAIADMIEWGTRKVDIIILGFFATPSTVGVYYVAQQVATLPQKLKTSFEPILGPVIT